MKSEAINPLLIRKYDQPVPRYTSYPTVPFWKEEIDKADWLKAFDDQFHKENPQKGISLYIHLPFCESLCTYCGCNKKITTNHSVEEEYLAAIEKEWGLYRKKNAANSRCKGIAPGRRNAYFLFAKEFRKITENHFTKQYRSSTT